MNFHVPIAFADGIVWLCRIRRQNASSPPEAAQDQLLLSEVATYQFLSTISVTVPRVYDYATASTPSNLIGVGYIMVEKIPGKPLDWSSLDKASKVIILQQLADIFIVFKNHPFPFIGSLKQQPDTLIIGPIAGQETYDVDDNDQIQSLGPFKSELDYRKAQIAQQLNFLIRREAWKDRAADGYLAFQHLAENVFSFVRDTEYPHFYLKHMDDKGDHILVDDLNNIVSIIDWEFAQTRTPSEAFAARLFLIDVESAYYDGNNDLSADEELWASILKRKGHQDLAIFVRKGRCQHCFTFCLGCGVNPEDLPVMILGFVHATKQGSEKENWDP